MSTDTVAGLLRDGSWQSRLRASLSSWVTLAILLAAVAANAWLQPTFFTAYSLTSNFATFAPLVLAAVAQSVVVIGGGLDLSIGAIAALSSVVALHVMAADDSRILVGLLAALATGAACGALNGFVVAVVRLQPLIATFATSSIFAGAALVVLPSPGGAVPAALTTAYRSRIAGVPAPMLIVLAALVFWLALERTRLMRHVRAVGGDRPAAFTSLVPVARTQWAGYTLAGTLVGCASMAILANTGAGDPFIGSNLALDSIAAVVLGGIALAGGRGSGIGAIGGALILSFVGNVISFLGVPTTWRQLVSGLVIIAALAMSVLTTTRERRP